MNDLELFHRLEALINAGQFQDALATIEEAKSGGVVSGPLLFLEGVAYHRQGRFQQAEFSYKSALALEPALAVAWKNLASLYYVHDESSGVVEALTRYREFMPFDREAYGWLVFSLTTLGRLQEAEQIVDDYRAVYPHDPKVLAGWAYVLEKQRRFVSALLVACSANAGSLNSSMVGHVAVAASQNLANHRLSRLLLDQVYPASSRDEDPDYLLSLADLFAVETNLDAARDLYAKAFEKGYSDPDGLLNIALVYLSSGEYEQGWKYYLLRGARYKRMGLTGIPEWRGESLQGKTILVHSEQGFGDVIQFIRYLPYLRETGAQVIFNTYPDVLQLLKHDADVSGKVEVPLESLQQCDFQTYMMDFPALLRPRGIADFPADVPYLRANPEKVAAWKERLDGFKGPRIGIVWAGNPAHFNDHNRSAAFSDFASLGSIPGITWFSLQKGRGVKEVENVPLGMTLINLAPELADFSETAAAVSHLDLVICVDTSVAHLVGAMGRECWLLLPAENQDWRWRGSKRSTPWYPHMRLFTQHKARDWLGLIDGEVRQALAEWTLERHVESLPEHDRISVHWHAGHEVDEAELAVWLENNDEKKEWWPAIATARWLALRRNEIRPFVSLRSAEGCSQIKAILDGIWAEYLLKQGKQQEAAECCAKLDMASLRFAGSDTVTALIQLWIEQRDFDRANLWLEWAQEHFSGNGMVHLLAARLADRQGKTDLAIERAERAISLAPRLVDGHLFLARLQAGKKYLVAADHFQHALQLSSDGMPIWGEIARLAFANRAPQLTVLILRGQVDDQPSKSLSVLLATALAEIGENQAAADIIQDIDPVGWEDWNDQYMLALAWGKAGMAEAQERTLRALLKEHPEAKNAHFVLGTSLLRRGACSEGWLEYNLGLKPKSYPLVPEWSGEPLAGKRLLIYQDQGYGDLIQFFTLLGDIDSGCQITLSVLPDIAELVRSQGIKVRVYSQIKDEDVNEVLSLVESGQFDYQIPFMKLPGLLGADLTRSDRVYPYLNVSKELISANWISICNADNNLKVGMAWAGNPHYGNDHNRSTTLDDWLSLASVDGVNFYSFQKDAASSQAYGCPQLALKNIAADCDSLLKTASALQYMDIFISVDTGLAHLAAALGKETWILLPDIGTDFRWSTEREDCPWYPSVRLFRRRRGELWASVLQRVAYQLTLRLQG